MVPAREDAVVEASLVATSGGVENIKVGLSLSGPEAIKLFERGGEAGCSFNSAGQPSPRT